MILRILASSMVALGLGLMVELAKAQQTFICEDGRMLQVAHQDVERLKRVEPCVAAHFGRRIQLVPLPVKRPALPGVLSLKGAAVQVKARRSTVEMADVGTDFRKVRIINAAPGGNGWYHHNQ